ncbi:sugar kinase [Streptomyces sp. NBC_00322]
MAALRAARPLRLGGDATLSIAGAEANVAIGLARLGHAARWTGVVGADELGALVLRTLRAERVDVDTAETDPVAPTGMVVFESRVAHVTRVTYLRTGSAGSRLSPRHVDDAFADAPRMLHVTGITPALGPGPRTAVQYAVGLARKAGVQVCLDVNHRARLWTREEAAAVLRPLMSAVDLLVASEDELPLAAPPGATSYHDRVRALHDLGVSEVIVKRGADGACVHSGTRSVDRPARPVPVLDTVGAGDAFTAGYLSGRLDGLGIEDCLNRAVTTAAFAVASHGDWEGLPTRADLALLDAPPGSAVR